MDSTPFGDAGRVISTGSAAPQDIDPNRGDDGRVRASDRD